jgi:hypothetical protein
MGGALLPVSMLLHDVVRRHKDNFTVTYLHTVQKLRMGGALLPVSMLLHDVVRRHKDNFTVTYLPSYKRESGWFSRYSDGLQTGRLAFDYREG